VLVVHSLSKSYGLNTVFKNISFSLNQGERAALVGPNGCGKSTLMNIIAREETPNDGVVSFTPSDLQVGYLHQGMSFAPEETLGGYLNQFESNLNQTLRGLEDICLALSDDPENLQLMAQYEKTVKALERAQEIEGSRISILSGFDLVEIPQETRISELSGGQKVRLALAGVLLACPDLLLLDEPTNHLDLEMRAWLRDWVLSYPGAILLVSHDRAFLDAVIHKVIAFPPAGDGVREYPGNYTNYLAVRQVEHETAKQAFVDQQDEIKRLKKASRSVRDLAKQHKGGKADPKNTDGFSVGFFANRSLETVRRAKQLEKRVAYLEGEGKLDKPTQDWELRMAFNDIPESGKMALSMDRLSIGYEGQPLLPPVTQTVLLGQRIALVGPNGVGKSTLFKTLIDQVEPISGGYSFGAGVKPGYLSQEQETLDPSLTVLETMQRVQGMTDQTTARTFLHRFLFKGDEVFQTADTLSYGQRSRMMLALLVANHCNFLLLDEPLNHLDIASQEAFEAALGNFEGTILASTHDQYFLDRFAQIIWHFSPGGIAVELSTAYVNGVLG
jgi:ATP-binding cassette subfamily F protein 3